MKLNMKHILSLGVLLLATSCMKEIDLEHLRPDPKLVLNCVVSQGEPLKASLSRTWFYTDNYPNVTIENATVNLFVNDRLVGEMNWLVTEGDYYSIGNYVSTYIPVSGDKVRIEAEKEGFRKVMAEEVVPCKPILTGFSVENIKSHNPYYSPDERRYKIMFQDNPSMGDCYLICIFRGYPEYKYNYEDNEKTPVYQGRYNWTNEYLDYATDPVFENKISILDKVMGNDWLSGSGGRPFSDELFNGKEYTMRLNSNSSLSYYWPYEEERLPDSVKVYLYTITDPYYKYLSALASLYDGSLNNDLADIGLAEPVRVTSNINGGLGILGAACADSLTVVVPKAN